MQAAIDALSEQFRLTLTATGRIQAARRLLGGTGAPMKRPTRPGKSLAAWSVKLGATEDRAGRVWIGTLGGGLDRFDPYRKSFLHYRHDVGDEGSLSDNVITAVFEDHSGVLWVGTENGLNRQDGSLFLIERLLPVAGYEVVNLGGDRPVPLHDIIDQIGRLTGRKPIIEYRDAHPADVPATPGREAEVDVIWLDQWEVQHLEPPALGDLGEVAEMFYDHPLHLGLLAGPDYSTAIVGVTNPELVTLAERTPAPNAAIHGYATIKDLMDGFNPLEGSIYLESLEYTRIARVMCTLMYGKYPHPSTLVPGGVSTTISTTTAMSRTAETCLAQRYSDGG